MKVTTRNILNGVVNDEIVIDLKDGFKVSAIVTDKST